MISQIRSVGFVGKSLNPLTKGSISMGVRAARKCVDSSGIDPSDIGLLIFCGIYRDENIGEPAIASIVQSKLGLNLLTKGDKATFAFDLLNSGCGVLTAIHVADSNIRSGSSKYALIVASDSIPIPTHTIGFPFQPGGGAVLLERSTDGKGLADFRFDIYPTDKDMFHSFIEYEDGAGSGEKKGQFLRFEENPEFLNKVVSGAVTTVKKLMEKNSLAADDIAIVLPSQSPKGFPSSFGRASGMGAKVTDLTDTYGNLHTAGIVACMEKAMKGGKLPDGGNIILLNVGSGISVGAALLKT